MASARFREGHNSSPEGLGHVAVLGLGVTGKAACRYLAPLVGGRVDSLTVFAGPSNEDARAFAEGLAGPGVEFAFDTEQVKGGFDVAVASPGIPQPGAFYQSALAASAEVISEVELAWRECPSDVRWVAVTGTNGKTTTTALAAHLLVAAGVSAEAVGNIGKPCIDAVVAGGSDVLVAEVSSYQLASTRLFAPDVAVLLNITPDHLAWHGSIDAYVDAKAKVLENLGCRPGAHAVVDAMCATSRAFVRALREAGSVDYVPLGTADGISGDMRRACGAVNAAYVAEGGMLRVCTDGAEVDLVHAGELNIVGAHNQANALASAAAALCIGANADGVRAGLRSFDALEHRIEPCGSVGGVALYNDSKATNPDATVKALEAFHPTRPIVLLGGDDKGTDLTDLVAAAEQHCAFAVCFGAAGPRIASALDASTVPHVLVGGLADALDAALGQAAPGDVVVLSPACASFDEFDNFEHRGSVFKQLVAARQE